MASAESPKKTKQTVTRWRVKSMSPLKEGGWTVHYDSGEQETVVQREVPR